MIEVDRPLPAPIILRLPFGTEYNRIKKAIQIGRDYMATTNMNPVVLHGVCWQARTLQIVNVVRYDNNSFYELTLNENKPLKIMHLDAKKTPRVHTINTCQDRDWEPLKLDEYEVLRCGPYEDVRVIR